MHTLYVFISFISLLDKHVGANKKYARAAQMVIR